jgi:hypothetical protein
MISRLAGQRQLSFVDGCRCDRVLGEHNRQALPRKAYSRDVKPCAREADRRWCDYASQDDLAARIKQWPVSEAVPEPLAGVLQVARMLMLDSYYTYEYSLVAVTWGLLATEASLEGSMPAKDPGQDRRTFRNLINQAREHELITPAEADALKDAARLRNHIVHGHLQPKPPPDSYTPQNAMDTLQAIHEAVSDLYDRTARL